MRQSSIELSRNIHYYDPVKRSRCFVEPYRTEIEKLTRCSRELSDLTDSFPAILFALASGSGDHAERSQAYQMICAGAPLKAVAGALNLPLWMKRLPPETFDQPFAHPLPDSPAFNRHIANLFPRQPHDMPAWFRKVTKAHQLCDENFALWVANNPLLYSRSHEVGENDACLELLAAWAWHSRQQRTQACNLIQTHWHPHIGLHKALDAAKTWYNRAKLVLFIGNKGIEDCWLEGRQINGFDIVPLRTADDFIAEAQAMGNCLDQYADQIRFHRVRVFSIRRDGLPIANIEIGPHEDDRSMPSIEQVRGPRNRRVNPIIWQLAYAWLGQQNFSTRPNGPGWPSVSYPIILHPLWENYRRFLDTRQANSSTLSIFNLDQTEKLLLQIEGLSMMDS